MCVRPKCGMFLLLMRAVAALHVQVFQQYVQYVREKQGVSQAEEDLVAGLQVRRDNSTVILRDMGHLCSTVLSAVMYCAVR